MKNLLTDKTLKAFEEWIIKHPFFSSEKREREYLDVNIDGVLIPFENLNSNFQFIMLVDFFDSVGIILQIEADQDPNDGSDVFLFYINGDLSEKYYPTRPEARKAALEKANELFNQIN